MNENKEEKNDWQNWNNETNEYVIKEITNEWTKECKVESDDGGGRNFQKRNMKRWNGKLLQWNEAIRNGRYKLLTNIPEIATRWKQKLFVSSGKFFYLFSININSLLCELPPFFMTWLLCLSLLFYFYNISFSFCCYSN